MIVNWKGDGLKVISVIDASSGKKVITGTVTLLPGHNIVKDTDWENMEKQDSLQLSIKSGRLVPIGKQAEKVIKENVVKIVEEEDEDGNISKKKKIEKKEKKITATEPILLKDMKAEEARQIVKDTYNLETLEAWRKDEGRDEIRAEIANQIDFVNRGGKDEE